MMIYTFCSKDGNVIRIGADCDVPSQLSEVMLPYSEAGYVLAEAAEYDAQVISGAAVVPAGVPTDEMVVEPIVEPSTEPSGDLPIISADESVGGVPAETTKE